MLTHAFKSAWVLSHLEKIRLVVSTHCSPGYTNDQGGKWVEASPITSRLCDGLAVLVRGDQGCGRHRSEPSPQTTGFKTHPDQAREPEHNGNADMLDLFSCIGVARSCAETFHPCVGYAVKEYHKGFNKLRGDTVTCGSAIPRPTKLGERPKKAGKSKKTVAPEDTALWRSGVMSERKMEILGRTY